MSDRLAELRRQRALLADHLAWLDREIAAEAKQVPAERVVAPNPVTPGIPAASPARALSVATAADATVATTVTVVAPGVAATGKGTGTAAAAPAPAIPPASTAQAEAMLEEYRVKPDTLKSDVQKGCLLYFALALGLVALGVTVLWFALK